VVTGANGFMKATVQATAPISRPRGLCASAVIVQLAAVRKFADLRTPRKLLFDHSASRESSLAQVALALRNAGYDAPGDHDLILSSALT
jgi:hypothetical protein